MPRLIKRNRNLVDKIVLTRKIFIYKKCNLWGVIRCWENVVVIFYVEPAIELSLSTIRHTPDSEKEPLIITIFHVIEITLKEL